MTLTILTHSVFILALITLLSLALNIKVIRLLTARQEETSPVLYPELELPKVQVLSDSSEPLVSHGRATALVFLATNCPKCKSKLGHLSQLIPKAQLHGVDVRIVLHQHMPSPERFFEKTDLLAQVAWLTKDDYLLLNAKEVSPGYLFVNEQGFIDAQGMLGDENWLFFASQVNEEPQLA